VVVDEDFYRERREINAKDAKENLHGIFRFFRVDFASFALKKSICILIRIKEK
jgi:hypothetical protein